MADGSFDLRDLLAGSSGRARACTALLEAFAADGFVTLSCGEQLVRAIAAMHQALGEVLALPDAVKQGYRTRRGPGDKRSAIEVGYVCEDPLADRNAPNDPTEIWYVLRELEAARREEGLPPNVWPAEVPSFRGAALELFSRMDSCATALVRGLAFALGEPEDRISGLCADGWAMLRLLRYPPPRADTPPDAMRSIEHEDFVFLTLYAGTTVTGLEARTRSGGWRPLRADGDRIVAAAGKMMGNLSNGLISPVLHRVRYVPGERSARLATPFGLGPRLRAPIAPMDACVRRTGGVAKYPETTAAKMLGLGS